MRHSELPDCCLEGLMSFHTPGCITIYITFHCIIGVDIFPYTSTRKTVLFPSWGIQYSNKIFNQGEKCCKQIRVWRIYSNIRIFEYIGHEYIFGHSFVSIFLLRIYSDIRSCQICLYEYIRTFVGECVRV